MTVTEMIRPQALMGQDEKETSPMRKKQLPAAAKTEPPTNIGSRKENRIQGKQEDDRDSICQILSRQGAPSHKKSRCRGKGPEEHRAG